MTTYIKIYNEAQFTDTPNAAQIVRIYTDATLAQVQAAGFLNGAVQEGLVLSPKNKYLISYLSGSSVDFFNLSISAGVYTLSVANTDVILPTIANHIAVFSNISGTLTEDPATAISGGNIQAGLSGTAGYLASFPGTAANGSLILAGVNAGANFTTTISNGTMAQSTVYSMGDIGAATGGLVVATSAIRMKSVAQAAVAGGAAAQTVTDAFCTSGSMVTCTWNDTTNAVTIQKAVAGNGSFVVTSSGDPGSSHLNYIITK